MNILIFDLCWKYIEGFGIYVCTSYAQYITQHQISKQYTSPYMISENEMDKWTACNYVEVMKI